MKRIGSVFERVCDFRCLEQAAYSAFRANRENVDALRFMFNLEPQLLALQRELEAVPRSHGLPWECIQDAPMGRSRYRFADVTQPHFMTCTVLHWIPVFTRPETVEILLDSLRYLSSEGFNLHAYVILENHMHLIAQSGQLDRDIVRFKSYTAKKVLAYLAENGIRSVLDQLAFYRKAHKRDRTYQFWQEGVHPEVIQGDDMMRQKIDYVHNNPVERGYVDLPEHWRCSSARNYAGREGVLDVCREW